jgi:DNA-binding GntR family transcriptional regulator
MQPLSQPASLTSQAYDALLDEICDGRLAANTRLVQDLLASRLGVSRQPIQQALLLLRQDGVVQETGRRGLVVAPLDPTLMRHHYRIRGALDALAASLAAERCAISAEQAAAATARGAELVEAGEAAVAGGSIRAMIDRDVAFHEFIYESSDNPLLVGTARPHWRYLRRVMGEVLRRAQQPPAVWQQHRAILAAITRGDAIAAEEFARQHVEVAAERLARSLDATNEPADNEPQGNADERAS